MYLYPICENFESLSIDVIIYAFFIAFLNFIDSLITIYKQ